MPTGNVVVTGASTGIGEASARKLASLGFTVFAGVRKQEDADRLASVGGIEPLLLDVTEADSVARAAERIGAEPLAGLVNNAGIAIFAPLEVIPVDELRRQFDVNVTAVVAMTQALLPALRRARGRVVNISSIGGLVALPLGGPYAASKFAVEALSDSLRREVASQGIKVVVVEPGGVKTPIWGKGTADAQRYEDAAAPDTRELYRPIAEFMRKQANKIATKDGLPPEAVADVVAEAMTADRPRTRYLVGRDAKTRAALARVLPDRAMDRLIARATGS